MRKLLNTFATGLMIALLMLALLLGVFTTGHAEEEWLYVKVKVGSTLNIRASADTKADIVGSLERGNRVTVLATSENWQQIHYGELIGWVDSVYLSADFPPIPYGGAYVTTAEPTLNVRDQPKGAVVCKLKVGSTVYVFERCIDEDGAEWSKLDEGWVMSQYIQEVAHDE